VGYFFQVYLPLTLNLIVPDSTVYESWSKLYSTPGKVFVVSSLTVMSGTMITSSDLDLTSLSATEAVVLPPDVVVLAIVIEEESEIDVLLLSTEIFTSPSSVAFAGKAML